MDAPEHSTTWRCEAAAIAPGRTATFRLRVNGQAVPGFVVNHGGRHHAYVNRCPHAGTPLDLWPNEFLTADGQRLICATHGAIFGPDTGICLEGPCPGARLEPLSIERDGEALVISCAPAARPPFGGEHPPLRPPGGPTPARRVLDTDRLTLRPFTAADAEAHARLYADPEVTRYLGGSADSRATPGERSARALAAFLRHWEEHGFGVWAVLERDSGRVVGQCGLKYLPVTAEAAPDVEVLYALERRAWGRGLAAEAAGAALRHGFETLTFPRIVAVTRPQHHASRNVMAKLGLAYERDVEVYGTRAVLYALTRETYLARRGVR